ncbi:MAG: M48 family metallopeptidase [Lysobacter sp.]
MRNPFRLSAAKPPVIERDAFELALDDGRVVLVRRTRDARARRIKLSVDERGARLTLPLRASAVSGERFAHEHRDWLLEQIDRHALDAQPALRGFESTTLPLRDAVVALRWQTGRHARLQQDAAEPASGLVFQLPTRAGPAAIARALHDFYEGQARADIGLWLPRYLPALPRAPRQFRFRQMSSQWGSLSPDGTVALDLSLILARPSAFEYVLVHELCHLIQANHSAAFWAEVEARCPHWREERDYFHAHGRRLKASLRALLDPHAGG